MAYFSGQGRVYVGERDSQGNPEALDYVGNVPELKIAFSIETLEHKESASGQRLTDLQIIKAKKGEFSCTLEELVASNLELALYGTTVEKSSGTVTDEILPGPVNTGSLYLLEHQNVSSVDIRSASSKQIPSGQYRLNAKHGSITFLDLSSGGPFPEPLKASYSYGSSQSTNIFTRPLPERWIRFEGLNTVDNNREVVIDLYRVAVNPASELSIITEELLTFQLSGQVLADTIKPADGDLGQFGRIVLL